MSATAPRRSLISAAWHGVLDVVFPPRCVSCRREWGVFLCKWCSAALQTADSPRCGICWTRSPLSPCNECKTRRPAFASARSVYEFEGPARDLVHALKYYGVSAVAPLMAGPMVARLTEWNIDFDVIVPVPMANWTQRRRGYNQSELLAREISRLTGAAIATRAIRRKPGAEQVRQPDRAARRSNALESYATGRLAVVGDVLLVDDVMTTGATLEACARVLRECGAKRVHALTFAREG